MSRSGQGPGRGCDTVTCGDQVTRDHWWEERGGHWTHWACGCLSRMFECLTREYFCRIYEWAVNDRGCCIPSSSWILPLNFTQMAPTPGKPFILTWLITNFRECSEFLLCSQADIKEPDCSFWDQGDSFSSLWMNAWAFSEKQDAVLIGSDCIDSYLECSLIALWLLSACSLTADLCLNDCLKIWARMMKIAQSWILDHFSILQAIWFECWVGITVKWGRGLVAD